MRRLGHAQAFTNQHLLGLEQAQALEVLHRRQQGAALEMLVKGRGTHVCTRRQGFDAQRLGIVLAQVAERRRDAGKVALLLHQGPQHPGLRPAQGHIQHFPHPRLAHHLAVQRVVQAAQQTLDTVTHGLIQRRRSHRLRGLRLDRPVRRQAHALHQLTQDDSVDGHRHPQQRLLRGGEGLAHERHRQRLHQVMPGAVFQGTRPEARQFAALGEDHQARLVDLRAAGHVVTGRQHLHLRQARVDEARAQRQGADQGAQGGVGIGVASELHGEPHGGLDTDIIAASQPGARARRPTTEF
ncbi:hypothetical protein D3C79_702580 [compost metagenome]